MTSRSAAAAIVVLAAATVWGQSTSPFPAAGGAGATAIHAGATRRGMSPLPGSRMSSVGTAAAHQRMQDMESTLNKMHALLKQMRAQAGSRSSKDQLAKANLDMWELMLGQLDKQFDQLRVTTLARDDFDARRAAMYKNAMDKADAAAQRAQHLAASQAMAAGAADQAAEDAKAGQNPATPSTPALAEPK